MIGSLNGYSSSVMMNVLRNNSSLMEDLTIQISTGKKAQTYGGLGADVSQALDLRSQINAYEGYQSSIEQAQLQISIMNVSLERVVSIGSEISGSASPSEYDITSNGQSVGQELAKTLSQEMIGLLNTDVDGDFVFSGTTSDTVPVISYDRMVYGYDGMDGLITVTDERIRADAGADGLGRLTLGTSGSTVTISEQATDFGYKISEVSSTLDNVTITGPVGSPASIDIDVTGMPEANQVLNIAFTLPDGSEDVIKLTGTSGSADVGDGEFSVNGTPDAIAASIESALNYQLSQSVASEGEASSRIQAAMDFYLTSNGSEPKRVVGTPETATSLAAASVAGKPTVDWYVGENDSNDARDTAKAQIDSHLQISYGARANEDSISRQLAYMTAFSLPNYVQESSADENRYAALAGAVSAGLSSVNQGDVVKTIMTELGVANKVMEDANSRHVTSMSMLQTASDSIEGINDEEVAAKLMSIRTTIESSYQAASMMYDLSLTNFI